MFGMYAAVVSKPGFVSIVVDRWIPIWLRIDLDHMDADSDKCLTYLIKIKLFLHHHTSYFHHFHNPN